MFSFPSSFRFLALLAVIVLVQAATTAEAASPIVDAVLLLFDAPHQVDTFHDSPGHFAEKTIEFLAFGDAAMDYYQ
jgi:hypothetical protein